MRGKILYMGLILLVLCSAMVLAQQAADQQCYMTIKDSVIDDTNYVRLATDVARFTINVTNNLCQADHFVISFVDEERWTILTEPEISYKLTGFNLNNGQSLIFNVTVRPKLEAIKSGIMQNGRQEIGYTVEAEDAGVKKADSLILYYGPDVSKPRYPAVVLAQIDMPTRVDPRKPLEVRILLQNKNPLNISGLVISLSSQLVNQQVQADLGPYEEKTVIVSQRLNSMEPPKVDLMKVDVSYEGQTIETETQSFEIVPYSQFEETSSTSRDTFYQLTTSYSFRNNGNVEKTQTVQEPISILKTLFISTQPKSQLEKDNGKYYLAWTLELRPNETQVVRVTENYLPLLIFVIVLLGVVIVIAMLRGPLTVNKTATLIAKKEGGIGGLKVVIHIKNRTKVLMRELEVVDSVPNIVAIDRSIEAGHLAPTNVVDRGSRGILVKWKLGDLEPGEEKIVSYKAQSRLTILGSFTLPATVVRAIVNYKEKLAYSNRLRIRI